MQAPLVPVNQAGPVRRPHAGSGSGSDIVGGRAAEGRRGGLAMAAVEEPWFEEAKATVLFELDDLE